MKNQRHVFQQHLLEYDQHLSNWLPHWFFHFRGDLFIEKLWVVNVWGIVCCLFYDLSSVVQCHHEKMDPRLCSSTTTKINMVFTHVIFSEPMPVHQSSSCTCWFLPEMTPGGINLAVNNLLNYLFNLCKIFSQSLLQIFEVVQIGPDFGPDYLD